MGPGNKHSELSPLKLWVPPEVSLGLGSLVVEASLWRPWGWVVRGKFENRSGKWGIFNRHDLRIIFAWKFIILITLGMCWRCPEEHTIISLKPCEKCSVSVSSSVSFPVSFSLPLCVCGVCLSISLSLSLSPHTHAHASMVYLSNTCTFPENLRYFSQVHCRLCNESCFNCLHQCILDMEFTLGDTWVSPVTYFPLSVFLILFTTVFLNHSKLTQILFIFWKC